MSLATIYSPAKFAEHLRLTQPRALALAKRLSLQDSDGCFKVIRTGNSFNCYSAKALSSAKKAMVTVIIDDMCAKTPPKAKNMNAKFDLKRGFLESIDQLNAFIAVVLVPDFVYVAI